MSCSVMERTTCTVDSHGWHSSTTLASLSLSTSSYYSIRQLRRDWLRSILFTSSLQSRPSSSSPSGSHVSSRSSPPWTFSVVILETLHWTWSLAWRWFSSLQLSRRPFPTRTSQMKEAWSCLRAAPSTTRASAPNRASVRLLGRFSFPLERWLMMLIARSSRT